MNQEGRACLTSGAKAHMFGGPSGTAEAVPFQNRFTRSLVATKEENKNDCHCNRA